MTSTGMKMIHSGTLKAGASTERSWNNPPVERVWQMTVVPSCKDDFQGSTAFAKASITWALEQERIGFESEGTSEETPIFKRRIRYKVENLAGQQISYQVFLSWVMP